MTTGSGASQGDGPQTIGAQLARGEKADVVILSREGLDGLIAANRIAAGTDADLATVGIGIAVRKGAAKPDLGAVDAVKQALLNARVVAVPASTSGIWLVKELFPKLGIHLGTGIVSNIIYSAIGAVILLLIVRLVRSGGRL